MASERSSRPPEPARPSHHVDPSGLYETAQHYVGDLVYGANDGILTTFAVVAGVTGGMGVGNYLSIRARESALERQRRPEEEARPARHGLATFLAFVVAGAVPLVPYLVPGVDERFLLALILAFGALFGVGAARSLVTASRWWISGVEVLGLGALVAAVAYATGAGIACLVAGEAR